MIRKKKLLLVLSMILLDEEICNYVDRKRWTHEWLKRREEKGACYTIFKELAVKDTPGFENFLIPGLAEVFFNFVSRGTKLHSFRWYPPHINNVSWLAWWSVFLEDFLWNEKKPFFHEGISVYWLWYILYDFFGSYLGLVHLTTFACPLEGMMVSLMNMAHACH